MKDYYKIDPILLDSVSTKLLNETITFKLNTLNSFSSSYLSHCFNDDIVKMNNKIKEHLSKIDNGYKSINKWLTDYSNDFNRVEAGLIFYKSVVQDEATNESLKRVLEYDDTDIYKSPDISQLFEDKSNAKTLPLIIDSEKDDSEYYQTLPLIVDLNNPNTDDNYVEFATRKVGDSEYDTGDTPRSFGGSSAKGGSRSFGGYNSDGEGSTRKLGDESLEDISELEDLTSFSDYWSEDDGSSEGPRSLGGNDPNSPRSFGEFETEGGSRSFGGFSTNGGSRSFGGYELGKGSNEIDYTKIDYRTLVDLLNNNPIAARNILRNFYFDDEINLMIRNRWTNGNIASQFFMARKRWELGREGYSRSQIDYYMRYYCPQSDYFLIESAVENGYVIVENGVYIVSDSYENAKKLLDYYHNFCKWGYNSELMKTNIDKSIRKGQKIFITDLDYSYPSGAYHHDYHEKDGSLRGSCIINIKKKIIEEPNYNALTHELGHHLRHAAIYSGDSSVFSGIKNENGEDLYEIGQRNKRANKKNFKKFKSNYKNLQKQIGNNIDTIWADSINSEVDKILSDKYHGVLPPSPAIDYERKAIKQKIVSKYYDQAITTTGYAAISDIYDALGFEAREQGMVGHGKDYYSRNDDVKSDEIAANLVDLYFNGNWNLVEENFPPDVVEEWEKIVMEYYK